MVFICAIPFNIHPTKLCFLNVIEEYRNGSVSKGMDEARKTGETEKIEDMVSDTVNATVVMILQLLLALTACLIKDLTIVFGVCSAFSECFTNIIFPGIFLMFTSLMLRSRGNDDDY